MSMGLTAMQGKCLNFIKSRIEELGVPPSFDDMATELGLRSKSGVHRIVAGLEARGHIRRLPNMARAIEVVPASRAVNLNPEIERLVTRYARQERMGVETAVNALLRTLLDADR